MIRSRRRVRGLIFLAVVHVLADITIALYRCLEVAPGATEFLIACFMRSQLCLIVLWLAIGSESLRWRVAGSFGCVCIIWTTFTRLSLSRNAWDKSAARWCISDWLYFFSASGPGDLLVKLPPLIVGTVLLSIIWYFVCWLRGRKSITQEGTRWFQLSFQDMFLFCLTASFAFAAYSTVAPYSGWYEELFQHVGKIMLLRTDSSVHSLLSSFAYVLIALASLWTIYSKRSIIVRAIVVALLAFSPAMVIDNWTNQTKVSDAWGVIEETGFADPNPTFTARGTIQRQPSDLSIALGTTVVLLLSLFFFRLHDDPRLVRQSRVDILRPPVLDLPPCLTTTDTNYM